MSLIDTEAREYKRYERHSKRMIAELDEVREAIADRRVSVSVNPFLQDLSDGSSNQIRPDTRLSEILFATGLGNELRDITIRQKLIRVILDGVRLVNVALAGSLRKASLVSVVAIDLLASGVCMSETRWEKAEVRGATIANSDISGSILSAAEFYGCTFENVDLSKCKTIREKPVRFLNCKFKDCNFDGANLRMEFDEKTAFENTTFRRARLAYNPAQCNLREMSSDNVNLALAELTEIEVAVPGKPGDAAFGRVRNPQSISILEHLWYLATIRRA